MLLNTPPVWPKSINSTKRRLGILLTAEIVRHRGSCCSRPGGTCTEVSRKRSVRRYIYRMCSEEERLSYLTHIFSLQMVFASLLQMTFQETIVPTMLWLQKKGFMFKWVWECGILNSSLGHSKYMWTKLGLCKVIQFLKNHLK